MTREQYDDLTEGIDDCDTFHLIARSDLGLERTGWYQTIMEIWKLEEIPEPDFV